MATSCDLFHYIALELVFFCAPILRLFLNLPILLASFTTLLLGWWSEKQSQKLHTHKKVAFHDVNLCVAM